MRFFLLFFSWIISLVGNIDSKISNPKQDTVSILADANFMRGLALRGTNTSKLETNKFLYPFGKQGDEPVWQLAEWGSKYNLDHNLRSMGLKNEQIYQDEGKLIAFKSINDNVLVRMEITASKEYSAPRQFNQPWPHLLLEQSFKKPRRVADIEGLILTFNGRLLKSKLKMPVKKFNNDLHSAQFQLFLSIQDLNKDSKGYGDYIWFGLPFYDYRKAEFPLYAAQDIGKGDATGKFIYSLGSADLFQGSFHDKRWININKDIYAELKVALQTAKERGYLKNSEFSDLCISGINIGWEVPGTIDVGFEFKNFDLKVINPKNFPVNEKNI